MTTLKKLIASALLLIATTTYADDYALMSNYPLLNDMKMAKQETKLIDTMKKTIKGNHTRKKEQLKKQKKEFTAVILGLSNGDSTLKLKGTKLASIKNQIELIQLYWSQKSSLLDSAANNKMFIEEAFTALDQLANKLNVLNKLYGQSYARYKQNSVMKSLVSSYMKAQARAEVRFAYNTVK